jgi:multidrug efflux pump subunit AcrA (membrane-fusion protein)
MHSLELNQIEAAIKHVAADRAAQFEALVRRRGLSMAVDQHANAVAQLEAAQAQGKEMRQAGLASATAARDEAKHMLDDLQADRKWFTIASGIDGVVVYGEFDHKAWHEIEPEKLAAGEKISPDQVVMTVYTPGKLRLNIECPESDLMQLKAGTKVQATPRAEPGVTYAGVCGSASMIGEADGPGQTFDVPAELGAVDDALVPGFRADVNFDGGTRDNVLLIPVTAVWHNRVWVVPPGSAKGAEQMRTVVLGESDGQLVEVKSGLEEGQAVLTQAKHPGGN